MNAQRQGGLLSRRRLLSAGAAAGGAATLAACMGEADPPYGPRGTIVAGPVPNVPAADPSSAAWRHGSEQLVALDGQRIALPNRSAAYVPQIKVRVIYDDTLIGFRLEWPDANANDLTVAADAFRDACAVLLAPGAGDQALRMMGTADKAATIMHWKADWQRDVDQGRQGIEAAFPNVVVDTYPPLRAATGTVTPQTYIDAKATEWLPGLDVGNPLSAAERVSPVEKILAGGFGTATTAPSQNCTGRGIRTDSGWLVALVRPLAGLDNAELTLRRGGTYTCAFAIWAGNQSDGGSRKSPSVLAWPLRLAA